MERTMAVSPAETIDRERGRYARRQMMNILVTALVILLTAFSVGILAMIFITLILNGASSLNLDFFTKEALDGGLANAIWGTLEMLAVAALIAVPLGVATAIYLSEYGVGLFASAVRFSLDLLAQMPSIVIGLFIWMFIVNYQVLRISGIAGALALSIIILPITARTVEEILRLVPDSLREAGLALGTPRWKVTLGVVIPTVLPGIMTGIVLALARAAGETAPLLLVTGNDYIRVNLFQEPLGAIPLQIYKDATSGEFPRAWGAALVLVLVIAIFSAVVRFITARLRFEA